MKSITQNVLAYANSQPEGSTVSAKELLHIGGRASVDQALSRLVKRGQLLRVGRGLYTCPIQTRFGSRAPKLENVLEDIVSRTGETLVPSGAVAANQLGLTTQNPVGQVFLTSGRSRELRIGQQKVSLRHAPAWQLCAPQSTSGQALRALAWLGEEGSESHMGTLANSLKQSELTDLFRFGSQGPSWLAKGVRVLAANA